MRGFVSAALAGMLLCLTGCVGDGSRVVEQPVAQVYERIARDADYAEGAALPTPSSHVSVRVSWAELSSITWHYDYNGTEFGRYVATMAPEGETGTRVTLDAQPTEAQVAGFTPGDLDAMRRSAQVVVSERLAASIEGRPFNTAAINEHFRNHVIANPGTMMRAVDASMNEAIANFEANDAENGWDAERRWNEQKLQQARAAERANNPPVRRAGTFSN